MKTSGICFTALATLGTGVLAEAASAATHSCPQVVKIQETCTSSGCDYVSVQQGKSWNGENPLADAGELRTLKFASAHLVNDRGFVACDYVGTGLAGLRMSLALTSPATPTGAAWEDEDQGAGRILQRCGSLDPRRCTFELAN